MIGRIKLSYAVCIQLLSFLVTLSTSIQFLVSSWHAPTPPLHPSAPSPLSPLDGEVVATDGFDTPSLRSKSKSSSSSSSSPSSPSKSKQQKPVSAASATANVPSFTGSRVTQISPGMLQYENVCVYTKQTIQRTKNNVDQIRKQLRLMAFTPNSRPLRIDEVYEAYQPNPGNYEFLVQTDALPVSEFDAHITKTSVGGVGLIKEPTLFTMQLHHNPGHCLSDMVFSIAWDAYARNVSHYERYAYGQWNTLYMDQKKGYQPDWCYEFMRHAGYIRPEIDMIPGNAQNEVCFETLHVPIFGLHRFPLDANEPRSVQAFREVGVMSHFRTHDFTDPALEYPVGALERLRISLCESLDMPCVPWDDNDDRIENADSKKYPSMGTINATRTRNILLYNRKGSPRRHWINADAVQQQLERLYDVHVTVVGEEWETMDAVQQLRLYNQHAYILTVHGAHEANLMAVRPGTRVMEVQCLFPDDPRPNDHQTRKDESDDPVEWYGAPSWFSGFSRRLGAEHFVYGVYEGCTNADGQRRGPIHQSSKVHVPVDTFVPFVANRFGLTPRDALL